MDKSDAFNPEDTMDGIWCRDSESCRDYLLDTKTGHIIAERKHDGTIVYHPKA